MTIAKPKVRPGAKDTESAFVAGAPDANPTRWQRGNKTQITFSISPDLLDQVDAMANRKHLSRAALMTVAINDWLEQQKS